MSAGCCVCEKPPVDALDVRVVVCRACAARLGRLLERSGDAVLSTIWRDATRPEAMYRALDSFDSPEAAQTHYDLGCAYAEMGLAVDAIRELAVALRPAAPSAIASAAFTRIFLSKDARPEALGDMILAFLTTK